MLHPHAAPAASVAPAALVCPHFTPAASVCKCCTGCTQMLYLHRLHPHAAPKPPHGLYPGYSCCAGCTHMLYLPHLLRLLHLFASAVPAAPVGAVAHTGVNPKHQKWGKAGSNAGGNAGGKTTLRAHSSALFRKSQHQLKVQFVP